MYKKKKNQRISNYMNKMEVYIKENTKLFNTMNRLNYKKRTGNIDIKKLEAGREVGNNNQYTDSVYNRFYRQKNYRL